MVVLVVLLLMIVGMTNQTSTIWRNSRARISAFQEARKTFERVTANLSQATLNTYLDYYDASGNSRADLIRSAGSQGASSSVVQNFVPKTYDRASDLQLVCGQASTLLPTTNVTRPTHAIFFACPLGHVSDPTRTVNDFANLERTLNAVGYYVEFSNDNDPALGRVPSFLNPQAPSWRYRLVELNQPSQNLTVYASNAYSGANSWFAQAVNSSPAPVLVTADNIVALIVRPKAGNPVQGGAAVTEIAPSYAYDTKAYVSASGDATAKLSKNQLPPLVQVTLVAIDAPSALRLAGRYGSTPPPLLDSSPFTDVTRYDADLASLQATLQTNHLNYRVFTTDVNVPGAKWSQSASP